MEGLVLSLLFAQLTLANAQLAHAQTINPIDTYREFAISEAQRRGINEDAFIKTLECESGFVADLQSHWIIKGEREQSFGVAQINLPSHPYISKKQALDPWFSIAWAAQQFSIGKADMWTCHRMHKKGLLSTQKTSAKK